MIEGWTLKSLSNILTLYYVISYYKKISTTLILLYINTTMPAFIRKLDLHPPLLPKPNSFKSGYNKVCVEKVSYVLLLFSSIQAFFTAFSIVTEL